jgi:uncharacterized protein (TIGR02246 family)
VRLTPRRRVSHMANRVIRQQCLITCIAGLLAACSPGPRREQPSRAADEEAIRSAASAMTAAEGAGDFERFMSLHTDDVVIMPPDQPAVMGKAAFTSLLRPFFDQFTLQETLSYSDIRVSGDWAVGTYTYIFTTTPKAGGAANWEQGKGVMLFRHLGDGSWKVTQAVWNRDHAPTPTALAK